MSIFSLHGKHLIEIWAQERTGRALASNTVLFCPYVTQASCYNDADQELNGSTAGGGGGTLYNGVQGEAPTGMNFLFRL